MSRSSTWASRLWVAMREIEEASRAEVLAHMEEKYKGCIGRKDRQRLESNGEIRWHNDVSWARQTFVNKGKMFSPAHGIWSIRKPIKNREVPAPTSPPLHFKARPGATDAFAHGRKEAVRLCPECSFTLVSDTETFVIRTGIIGKPDTFYVKEIHVTEGWTCLECEDFYDADDLESYEEAA